MADIYTDLKRRVTLSIDAIFDDIFGIMKVIPFFLLPFLTLFRKTSIVELRRHKPKSKQMLPSLPIK